MEPIELHRDALVWDAHRDVAYEAPLEERFLQGWMIGVDMYLPLLKKGGIDAEIYAICVAEEKDLPPTAQALKELDKVMSILDDSSDMAVLVTKADDILKAKRDGRIAVILGFEGGEPILKELGLLRMFYRMGLRHMSLTWSNRNALADGRREGREGGGLSKFGVKVVEEMNRLGMLVDVAHMTPKGMRQVAELSETPVINSHSSTCALNPEHPRSVGDDVLEAIASKGGVFCIATIPSSLSVDPSLATLEHFLDDVDHAVSVIGDDHVGLGADFDVYQSHLGLPAERWLKDLEEVDKWPNVTAGLVRRGYSETSIRKILGENLLRVFREVVG